MRSHPGDLVALNETPANLIDAAHVPRREIILDHEISLDRVRCPRLPWCHARYRNFSKLARLFQPAVPLPYGTLPLTHSDCLCRIASNTDTRGDVAANRGGFSNCFAGIGLSPHSFCYLGGVGRTPGAPAPSSGLLLIQSNDPVNPQTAIQLDLQP